MRLGLVSGLSKATDSGKALRWFSAEKTACDRCGRLYWDWYDRTLRQVSEWLYFFGDPFTNHMQLKGAATFTLIVKHHSGDRHMNLDMRNSLARTMLVIPAMLLSLSVHSQEYPNKAIKIIVPFTAGGGIDRVARTVGDKLRDKWGQPVLVENISGANGNLGAEALYRSAPDGYTLMLTSDGALGPNKLVYSKLNYDPETFVPVSVVSESRNLLVVNPKLGVETVQQLIAAAKANPGRFNFASQGVASTAHLSAELFQLMAGITMVHVPYKGGGPSMADLLAGHVDMMFAEIGTALPHIQEGKLRALAVGAEKRNSLLPDVPSMSEILPGFYSGTWYGMAAPAKTSTAIIIKLSSAVAEALRQPDVIKRLLASGSVPVGSTPEEMAQRVKRDLERVGNLVQSAGIRLE